MYDWKTCVFYIIVVLALSHAAIDYGVTQGNQDTTDWDTDCPAKCHCFKDVISYLKRKMKIINCTGVGLEMVPRKIPQDTEVLILADNNITKVRKLPYVFGLKYLDLSNNQIKTVDNSHGYLFSHMKELQYLSLSRNNLHSLMHGSFSGLLHLDYLDLSCNHVSEINKHTFAGLNYLRQFNFEGNNLKKLDPDWLEDIFDLRELYLSHNSLKKLPAKVFSVLKELEILKLSNNQIADIHNKAFLGLPKLSSMDLSNNLLKTVPILQAQNKASLKIMTMDGNFIHKLAPLSFSSMNTSKLSVSYMPKLAIIEKNAFTDLPHLTYLFLHDNPQLLYIDSGAFSAVPLLTSLYVHNNNLQALPATLELKLPNLQQVHLYHNPLRCDCNAYWLKQTIQESRSSNITVPNISGLGKVTCKTPNNVTSILIEEAVESLFQPVCAPTALAFFEDSYTFDLGEELRLECHGIGVPEPTITWMLPDGKELNSSVSHEKAEILDSCTLVVRYLNIDNSGTYYCRADNAIAYDISSTVVNVSNKPVRLVLYSVSKDYITISWNGTKHRSMISDYQIQYRNVGTDADITIIHLGPFNYRYTIPNLQASTLYEFCLVYVYETEQYKVDCQNFTTTASDVHFHSGITKIINEKIVAGVCTAIALLAAAACIFAVLRRFKRSKNYEAPYDSEESEALASIPMDTLYQPLSTPLCSSKTSLIMQLDSHFTSQ